MSNTKKLSDSKNKQAGKWIRKRLKNKNSDENSKEWKALEHDYNQGYFIEQCELQAELEWLNKNGSSEIHQSFILQLDTLKKITDKSLKNNNFLEVILNHDLIHKIAYSYAVTLLEAFLGDTLKSLINENPKYLNNAIVNVKDLKSARYSLSELSVEDIDVNRLVLKKISELMFHNIRKIKTIYEEVLGYELKIDISEILKIINIRHHIVHRNGKTIDGEHIKITIDELSDAIIQIKKFADGLQLIINSENPT